MIKDREWEKLVMLKQLAAEDNSNGNDSRKRSAALEVLAGPADTKQTDRLLKLAIAIIEARG